MSIVNRCYWRMPNGLVITADVIEPRENDQLIIRILSNLFTGEYAISDMPPIFKLVRRCDVWSCRICPSWGLLKLKPSCDTCHTNTPPLVTCYECKTSYHKHCTVYNVQQSSNYPDGFFRCRNCCFLKAVRPFGALKSGPDADYLRSVKTTLPYNIKELTWSSAELENLENKYCYCGGSGLPTFQMFRCIICKQFFHQACVQDLPTWLNHGLIAWDRFFVFICACCNKFSATFSSTNGTKSNSVREFVFRLPMRWVDLCHLSMLNMCVQPARQGQRDYHWSRDVCAWIRSNWYRLYVHNLSLSELESQVKMVLTKSDKRFEAVDDDGEYYRLLCSLRPPVVTPPLLTNDLNKVNWSARVSYPALKPDMTGIDAKCFVTPYNSFSMDNPPPANSSPSKFRCKRKLSKSEECSKSSSSSKVISPPTKKSRILSSQSPKNKLIKQLNSIKKSKKTKISLNKTENGSISSGSVQRKTRLSTKSLVIKRTTDYLSDYEDFASNSDVDIVEEVKSEMDDQVIDSVPSNSDCKPLVVDTTFDALSWLPEHPLGYPFMYPWETEFDLSPDKRRHLWLSYHTNDKIKLKGKEMDLISNKNASPSKSRRCLIGQLTAIQDKSDSSERSLIRWY